MSVTDTKVMSEITSVQIRAQDEAVLVDFIRVVRDKSDPRCECILSDHVSLNQLRLYMLQLVLDT